MKSKTTLFTEFDSVSSKQWKQKIQADLKGKDYNDTLIWNSREGIDVKPFYHSDDIKDLNSVQTNTWKVSQSISVKDATLANQKALDTINRGAESILFYIENDDISIKSLINNIDLNAIDIDIFHHHSNPEVFLNQIRELESSKLSYHFDSIGNLAKTGNWYSNLKDDREHLKMFVKEYNQLSVNLNLYQNAGATIIQQLAYGLSHVNEYLNEIASDLTENQKNTLITRFNVSVGANYFFEISKLKALRLLWKTLAAEYAINTHCRIIAQPSKRNKTIYDYNTNMLRTTTEMMSAALGGSDIVCNIPYDALYHEPNEFGERISRNQLLILKNESYFDKVDNPTEGSYYIEALTQQFAEKALSLFKDIEENGGFLHQLKEGIIQRKIEESATIEQSDFDEGKITLLGTNKYQNSDDRMKNELEKHPFLKIEKRKTLIKPIIQKRLSENLEIKRLEKE